MKATADDFLALGPRIRVLPIIHGSGDFAIRTREELLERPYDCLAVPLPESFQEPVERAVERLPQISAVIQRDATAGEAVGFSYVPIDPCQGVIAAIRTAMGERISRAFIDMETPHFEASSTVLPDPYALKRVSPAGFAAATLPTLGPPIPGQHANRILWMAQRLRELERFYKQILFVCSLPDWPWIRQAYRDKVSIEDPEPFFAPIQTFLASPRTLLFLLGELPFITALYERGRIELTADDNLSVDGVKEMVLAARDRLKEMLPRIAQRLTPQALALFFRYVRNLCLMEKRLTPDLYTLVTAAKQTAGDDFALALAETARTYPYHSHSDDAGGSYFRMGIGMADVPPWGVGRMVSRLPGQAVSWRRCELKPRPPEPQRRYWRQRWDPYSTCSWPPEDVRIESFHTHVREQARAILGQDLARSEKFTTSVMDGLDIRETLRHWHTGDIYVKVLPPSRGSVEVTVFLFEVPADPQKYVHRATWFAEHAEESTLAFYTTDPLANMIGPGIAQCEYGGAMFLYPPRPIPDIWLDRRLDFADTLEERLLAGACLHSQEKHVAVVSPRAPSAGLRRLARRFGRKLVHLPLRRFSGQLVERLRIMHVLNGKHVRSYAADFIRGE